MNDSENIFNLNELIALRKSLHANPELAHKERTTAEALKNFIIKFNPDEIIENIGGNGIAFIYKGKEEGPTVLIRAELDALPIIEECEFDYISKNIGISHKCGHDGHMTILAGLAHKLNDSKPSKGKVVLLFQPAEEIGEGAEKVIFDEKFKEIKPDYAFALHNLPGFEKHEIIVRNNIFAVASVGMKIQLIGKTSHAAHPENGISPANAAAEIIQIFNSLIDSRKNEKFDFGLVTVIHVNIGEKAFGTSPGYAEIYATLRANSDDDLEIIKSNCVETVKHVAENEKLKFEISWTEAFPATVNDVDTVNKILNAADQLKLKVNKIDSPFRWTEDFGHFTKIARGALFGLGAGKQTPQLHNPDYDFPDELISTGINVFYKIVNEILIEE
jgi:amidohydrolase